MKDDPTQRFISELIRAANETEKLAKFERQNLLRRAAATIRSYRDMIDYSEAPANDTGPGDLVHELEEMARVIDLFKPEEVGETLLRAVDMIKVLLSIWKIKLEILDEDGPVSG